MKKIIGYIIAGVVSSLITVLFVQHNISTVSQQQVNNQPKVENQVENKFASNTISSFPESTVNFKDAAKQSIDAVVHVKTIYESKTTYHTDPFMEYFFGNGTYKQRSPERQGTGSGVIISENGYIITNNHVIAKADKVEITLNNNQQYFAEVIGTDPSTDIALLKIESNELPNLKLGNSDEVEVGEWVLAVGNPYNLNSTVTAGIVSAKGRDINILRNKSNKASPIESFIQTDAAVNPGNSGGALVNTKGELIGINTAIKSNTGSYSGYSFAVPINIAKKIIEDIKTYGIVQRAYIGISIQELNKELIEEENIDRLDGVYIGDVIADGSAKKAGIKKGDIITKIDGKSISNIPELQEKLSNYRPGDAAKITVERKNEEQNFNITLQSRNGSTAITDKATLDVNHLLGAVFESPSEEEQKKLSLENGLKVSSLKMGKLRAAGLKEGFIITKFDNKKVESVKQLSEMIKDKKGGALIEGFYPNGEKHYYGLGL